MARRTRRRSRPRRIRSEEEEEGRRARTAARELLPNPQRDRDPRRQLRYRRRRDHRYRAETLLRTQPPGGRPRTPARQRADAIVDIFRHYLDHQHRGANRPHVIVVVDGATLAGEAVGRCETISGYQLHPESARRLACDAFIQRIVLDSDGVPLDMGRATRTFTPDQYRAIMVRDGGCRMPGCDAGPEDCEAHHATTHWEDGGLTDLAVGLAVCRGSGHHRLIHEGGWTITGDPNGEVTFHDPDGNPRGTTRPRNPPKPILTRAGRDVTRAQKRATRLGRTARCHAPAWSIGQCVRLTPEAQHEVGDAQDQRSRCLDHPPRRDDVALRAERPLVAAAPSGTADAASSQCTRRSRTLPVRRSLGGAHLRFNSCSDAVGDLAPNPHVGQ